MGRRKAIPVAPAEPKSANADPVFMQYLEMSNLLSADSKGTGMSFSLQRALSRSTIIAPIKQILCNWGADFAQPQMSPYSIGWRIAKSDRRVPYTQADWRNIDEISAVIARAGYTWFPGGFESFTRDAINNSVTHDAHPFEIIREDAPPGRIGRPWAFVPVDPATIRRAIPDFEPGERTLRWDYEDVAFVQVVTNGTALEPVAEFASHEMHLGIRRGSSWLYRAGYGMPELEEYAPMIAAFVNAVTSNAMSVTSGIHIPNILFWLTKQEGRQWDTLRQDLITQVAGVRKNRRQIILKGNPDLKEDIKSIPAGSSNQDMEFMAWLDFGERMVCAMYNLDQRVVFPRSSDMDRSRADKMSPTERALMSKERGFRPILRAIATWINEAIVSWWPGYRFDFVGFDSQSERDKLEMDIKAVTTFMSPNELRAERNLPPFDDPISNRPLNSLYQAWIQQQVEQGMPIPGLEVGADNISAWVNGRRLPDVTSAA